MKTKCILLLLIVCKFSAFAQQRDTMIYHPTYSATETFGMRVGRLLETRITYVGAIYSKGSNFIVNVNRLHDLRSGERQIGVEFKVESTRYGMVDEEELDEFIKNLETIYESIANVNSPTETKIWFTTKGGVRIMLTYMPKKSAFSPATWRFTVGVFKIQEWGDNFEDCQLDKIHLPTFIILLKNAQREIRKL